MSTKGTAIARHHLGQVTPQLVVPSEHLLSEQTKTEYSQAALIKCLFCF